MIVSASKPVERRGRSATEYRKEIRISKSRTLLTELSPATGLSWRSSSRRNEHTSHGGPWSSPPDAHWKGLIPELPERVQAYLAYLTRSNESSSPCTRRGHNPFNDFRQYPNQPAHDHGKEHRHFHIQYSHNTVLRSDLESVSSSNTFTGLSHTHTLLSSFDDNKALA